MNESEFNTQFDSTLLAIENLLDRIGADIDYDREGSVLTLEFADHSKVILSRQPAINELWLAARSGGFHFSWQDGQWRLPKNGESLASLLSRVCTEQSGISLKLDVI